MPKDKQECLVCKMWLGDKDSNLDYLVQSQACYRCTISHRLLPNKAAYFSTIAVEETMSDRKRIFFADPAVFKRAFADLRFRRRKAFGIA